MTLRLYSFLLWLFQLFAPLFSGTSKKFSQWLAARGQWKEDLAAFEREPTKKVLWFHCASVGEFEQARPVMEALKSQGAVHVVVTFFSPSGYRAKKDYQQADCITYLPLDLPGRVRAFLDMLRPDVAVFVKYELWFNFLRELEVRGIPTALISAHFPHKHWTTQWPGIHLGQQIGDFDRVFAQSEVTCSRLNIIGIDNCEVAGDTRVDRVIANAKEPFEHARIAKFAEGGKVLVVGSNWSADDVHLIPVFRKFKELKVIAVPHEIRKSQLECWKEEFGDTMQTIEEAEIELQETTRVIFVNRIGMLSKLYRYGHVAYVGGGFGRAVHNTLEAAVYGIPVIFGPNNKRFVEVQALKEIDAGTEVKDDDELKEALTRAFDEEEFRTAVKQKLATYFDRQQGATQRIVEWIKEKI